MWWLEPARGLPAWERARTAEPPTTRLYASRLNRHSLADGHVVLVDSDTGGWVVTDPAGADLLTGGSSFSTADGEWAVEAWRRGLLRSAGGHVLADADLPGEAAACRDTYGLVLLLNGGCNLVCTYCYLGHSTPSKQRELPIVVAEDAIRAAVRRPERQIIVDLGEIAVSSSWRHLASFTRELTAGDPRDIRLTVQTNGTSLDRSTVDFLARNEITVGVSLDGSRELHDRARVFRTGAGSHALAVAGLRRCVDAGVRVHLIATIARHNVEEPEAVVEEILSHHAGSYLLKPVLAHGEAATAWDLEGVTAPEYGEFMSRAIAAALVRGGRLDESAGKFARRMVGDPVGWADGCTSRNCGSGRSLHVLASDGEMFACPRFVTKGTGHRPPPGPTMLPLLLSPRLRTTPETCSGCSWLRSCGGGCTLSGHDGVAGAVPLPDPQCAAYQEIHRTLLELVLAPAALGAGAPGTDVLGGCLRRATTPPTAVTL